PPARAVGGGAPQLPAAPSIPPDPTLGPAAAGAVGVPRQPGVSDDTTTTPSTTVVRQPGVTADSGR
ncbi:hypothetical protein ACFWPJ_22695, partial [Nocardia sp. NPDC058497]